MKELYIPNLVAGETLESFRDLTFLSFYQACNGLCKK
jgi:hypothetical protein